MQYVVSKYADRYVNSCSMYSLQTQLHVYPLPFNRVGNTLLIANVISVGVSISF